MRLVAAAVAIAVVLLADRAGADVCARPDLLDTFPNDGATNVPTNVILRAHYAPTAEYVDESVTIEEELVSDGGSSSGNPDGGPPSDLEVAFKSGNCAGDDGGATIPPGSFCFSASEGLLKLRPPRDLTPGHAYTVRWPSLRGTNTASRGNKASVTFTVGSGPDLDPPEFDGLEKVDWDVDRNRDDCTSSEQDRFYFDLTPGKASDDFGTESLALVVFQSMGPSIAPTTADEQVAVLPFPDKGGSVRVELSLSDAKGDVCFAALVKDLAERTSSGNGTNKQVCTKTKEPPFFYGCALSPRTHDPRTAAWPLVVLLLFGARRRHRSTP